MKTLRLFLLFWMVPVLFCIIEILVPCREYHYEGSETFGGDYEEKAVYEGISLSPGVYRVELEYAADADLQGMCNVSDGTVFQGGLLSNGEPLYRGLAKTGYHIWLLEKTDGLQVRVSCFGGSALTTGNLKIVETNRLWTLLLTLLLIVGTIVFVLFYVSSAPVEKKQSFFLVTVIGLMASYPYLCGYNVWGTELGYHLQRIEGIQDGLLGGQFPVRLAPGWLYGHGYAETIFNSPLFLYFPALLRLLGFPVTASYNLYCIACNLATAWISYFCFSRMCGSRQNGIICSALYTLSVYRTYRLLFAGALDEGSALAFLPLVLYGMYRIFAKDPKEPGYETAWIPVMLGLAGLIQTHMVTFGITVCAMLAFCALNCRKLLRRPVVLQLGKGVLAAFFISLWFLVPFLDYYVTQPLHMKYMPAVDIQGRGLYFAQLGFHFWGAGGEAAGNGMRQSGPVGVGLVLTAGLGFFLIFWFSGKLRDCGAEKTSFAKNTALIGLVFLLLSLRIFPWDMLRNMHPAMVSVINRIQFPGRFLGWGTVCLVLVFGYCLEHRKAGQGKGYGILLAAALLGIATSDLYLMDQINGNLSSVTIYNEEGMGAGNITEAEYIPEGTDQKDMTYRGPEAGDGVEIAGYEKNDLRTALQCSNHGEDESFVDLPLLYYKGYEAAETDSGRKLEICAGKNNVVRVKLPAGFQGGVEIRFVPPVYWRISEWLSALALSVLIARIMIRNRRSRYA